MKAHDRGPYPVSLSSRGLGLLSAHMQPTLTQYGQELAGEGEGPANSSEPP